MDEDDELLSQPVFLDNVVVVDYKSDANDYMARLKETTEKEFQEFLGNSATENQPMVYVYCPICNRQKGTKADHVKTCAKQNGISPKEVLILMKDVPQQVDKPKKMNKPKKTKIIQTTITSTFKTSPPSQICDEKHKANVIESRLSKFGLIDNNNLESNNFELLPSIWTAADLSRNFEDYIITSFKQYF